MTWTALYAGPAAIGFAILFNVRRRALVPVAVLAVAAKVLVMVLVDRDVNIVAASFAGALLVGSVAYTLGPYTGEAAPVYGFASVVPLLPGVYAFNALRAVESAVVGGSQGLQALTPLTTAATNAMTMAAVVLALAIGATSPMLLLPGTRTPED